MSSRSSAAGARRAVEGARHGRAPGAAPHRRRRDADRRRRRAVATGPSWPGDHRRERVERVAVASRVSQRRASVPPSEDAVPKTVDERGRVVHK